MFFWGSCIFLGYMKVIKKRPEGEEGIFKVKPEGERLARRSRERSRRRSEPTRSVSGAATNFPLGKFGLRPLLMGSFGVGTVLLDGTVS